MNNKIEVSFSPLLYPHKLIKQNFSVVVVDIFRATTSICAALEYGIESVIPVATTQEAEQLKNEGYLVACERNGKVLDFADIGNSPSDFQKIHLKGKQVVFSTTNGTQAIRMASDADHILVGSFLNLNAVASHLASLEQNVVILCAAWKNLFNLEDTIFAGALAKKLVEAFEYETECDATKASVELWEQAESDLTGYLAIASHRHRLHHLLTAQDYRYTLTPDTSTVVPVYNGELIADHQSTFKTPTNSGI